MSNKPPCFLLLLISYFLVVFCFLLLALSNPCCSSFFCSSILKTRCKRVFQSLIKILLALLMQLLHYLGKNKTKQKGKQPHSIYTMNAAGRSVSISSGKKKQPTTSKAISGTFFSPCFVHIYKIWKVWKILPSIFNILADYYLFHQTCFSF